MSSLFFREQDTNEAVAPEEDEPEEEVDEEEDGDDEEAGGPVEPWEASLMAKVETAGGVISEQDILQWTRPEFKNTKIYFSPEHKPSDEGSWNKLRAHLRASATSEGFGLVSKGARGVGNSCHVMICSRGRVYKRDNSDSRPRTSEGCCKFRFAVHSDRDLDRFYIKGGNGCAIHSHHGKGDGLERRKRQKTARSPKSTPPATVDPYWPPRFVSRQQRWEHHPGAVLWFSGLSGSGKTTIANEADYILYHDKDMDTYVIDEDEVKKGLCSDLGTSASHRRENMRRVGEMAKIFANSGRVVLCSFISPYQADRDMVRSICGSAGIVFAEIYVEAPLEVCERRDPKGTYVKARAGLLHNVTGIDDPYEVPAYPDLVLHSGANKNARILAQDLVGWLETNRIIQFPLVDEAEVAADPSAPASAASPTTEHEMPPSAPDTPTTFPSAAV